MSPFVVAASFPCRRLSRRWLGLAPFLFALALSTPETRAATLDCSARFQGVVNAQSALQTKQVPGLYEQISVEKEWKLPGPAVLQFQDRAGNAGYTMEVDLRSPGVASARGLLILSQPKTSASVELDVISLDPGFPRMLRPAGQLELVPGKGTPSSVLLVLRGLKQFLGAKQGKDFQSFVMHKVRNWETVYAITRELAAMNKPGTQPVPITASQFLEIYKASPLHRLAETSLTQAGLRIKSLRLKPNDFGKVLEPDQKLWFQYSVDSPFQLDDPAVIQMTVFDGSQSYNFKHPYIDTDALKAQLSPLIQRAEQEGLVGFPFDFSVVYGLEAMP